MTRRQNATVRPAQLEAVSTESSERERIADQAERELFEWKKMILMERRLGDTFAAVIIAVWKDGFTVELTDQFIEGFVHVSEIVDDYYQFEPHNSSLIGKDTGNRFSLGDRLRVQVARVDKLLRRAYFVPVLARGRRSR
jgi:ribonuclease R